MQTRKSIIGLACLIGMVVGCGGGGGGDPAPKAPATAVGCTTTAATAGLTLYDTLCGGNLDGKKWLTPAFSRTVVNGELVASTDVANMEPYSSRGFVYTTLVLVNDGGQRVSTLQATINVPSASASRTGGAEIRAGLRLAYQPPEVRLNFPALNLDLLTLQVGVRDDGNGPRLFREVSHCDTAACTSPNSSGISFADPIGFTGEAPAAYDTAYVLTAALNESTGILSWTITGAGVNLSGTANPATYLAGNANWTALGANPLATTGFLNAALRTRAIDNAGGSKGVITARFDDVKVGFNNAAATSWDDFSGTGANSGPAGLSAAKWALNPGTNSLEPTATGTVGRARATTPSGASLSVFHAMGFSDPAAINTVQADFNVSECSNSLSGTNRIGIAGAIYNDGTPGTIAPDINQANSRVGDITASIFIDCTLGDVRFQVTRFDTNGSQTVLSNSANAVVPKSAASVVGSIHTLRMKWDPVARQLTFQADGQAAVVFDPTTTGTRMTLGAPFVKAPNVPNKSLNWFLFFPNAGSAGATANVAFQANNVYVAP
jgi:hypothetical protein